MRIVIDLQGAQTESRFRGVGRYTLAIAKAMCRAPGAHQVVLLLNGALPDAIPFLRRELAHLVAADDFLVFEGLPQSRAQRPEQGWRHEASALLREAFIAALEADAVFVPGFFEGYVDDAAVSAGAAFPVPVIATLHDLIPLLNRERYLEHDPVFKRFYERRIEQIKSVAALAAVSQSASEEATDLLGFDAARIADTSEAADELFRPLALSRDASRRLRERFGLSGPYLLYAGGADPRKNLHRLVGAFGQLPAASREQHQLLVVGRMGEGERAALVLDARQQGLPDEAVVIAGYVPDEDLVRLYSDCALFVMPSLHEGFGLPALEAMQSGAPTIGSNSSSLPEVIGLDEAMFDPLSVSAMRERIERVLTDEALRSRLVAHGLERAKQFSWEVTARRTIGLIERVVEAQTVSRDWPEWQGFADGLEGELLKAIVRLEPRGSDADLADAAQAIADNRRLLDARKRRMTLPVRQSWRLEGPFDSSYSLALVNRELARAMIAEGHEVVLHSAEGDGSYLAPAELLRDEPELAVLFDPLAGGGGPGVVSRNLYPPRAADSGGRFNFLHNYAWEETGFPSGWVDDFNDHLQGITVTAEHVKKVLVDNGVAVPIEVVGNGVDHWQRVASEPFPIAAKKFRFLHVSSGFPRKGLDVLLAAYAAEFTSRDDVSLVIKTFDNPHNSVEAQIEAVRRDHAELGDIVLIKQDLTPGQLKGLYEQCQVMVAPSRAEGFGLPLAEAVVSGLTVLATGWSGQLDFLGDDPQSLVDFEFAPAKSHLPVFGSVWAEPSATDLAWKMRWALEEPQDSRTGRLARLGERLEAFTWRAVARRTSDAAARIAAAPVAQAASVAWVSTFAARCGIATYSQHLIDALPLPVQIFAAFDATAVEAEGYNVERLWSQGDADLSKLTEAVLASPAEAVVVQFNYGFFDFPALKSLLRAVHGSGRTVVVFLHSTRDPAHDTGKRLADLREELALCDRLLVHSVGDLNRLKALGLTRNVTLFPHGVLDVPALPPVRSMRDEPIIASYGFFLPNKGLPELIEAFALLRADGFKGRLRMVNAEFPAPISASMILEARRLIRERGLQSVVELHTDFLSDEQSLALLAPARMVVYPYQDTAESASGAVRYGLASRLPVVTTPLSIFDDVAGAVFPLPGMTPREIALGIRTVLQQLESKDAHAVQTLERAAAWRENHVYGRLGRRLGNMINALVRDKGA